MKAPAAADWTGRTASGNRRRLAKGMAAAAALSLAVHAAVLLGRASAGSSASSALPQVSVLLTRTLVATAPVASEEHAPALSPATVTTAPEPVPRFEPARSAPEIPLTDRVAVPVAAPSPVPRVSAVPASAVPTATPPESVAAPVTSASESPLTYLGSGGLDPPPRPLTDIDPAVPVEAGPRGGVVVLRLYINERGGVDKAEVLNSAPPGLFDASVLESFSNARFSPGYFAGVPVKSQVTVEVKFRALSNGSPASARTY